jgi:hypothetical protein
MYREDFFDYFFYAVKKARKKLTFRARVVKFLQNCVDYWRIVTSKIMNSLKKSHVFKMFQGKKRDKFMV